MYTVSSPLCLVSSRILAPVTTFLAIAIALAGCATTSQPPPPVTSTVRVPTFSYTEDASAVQKKGGVTIELIPASYDVTKQVKSEERDKPKPFMYVEPDPNRETFRWFDKVETPYYVPNPPNLLFAVKITNQMDGTLRMAGSIVTYQVDGRPLQVPLVRYAQFQSSIVPRRQTVETSIEGPPLDELKDDGGQVFVSIDDVITERDAAGNPTRRANFEWIFSYSMESITKTDQITITPMKETRQR